MTIETLSNLLTELAKSVAVLSGDGSADQLRETAKALRPFKAFALHDFAAFLHKAEDYHKTGVVPTDPPGFAPLRHAVAALHAPGESDHGHHQDAVAKALGEIGQSAGLKIAPPKKDPKWADSHKNREEVSKAKKHLTELAGRITNIASLEEDGVRSEIDALAELAPVILKDAAIAVGVSKPGKKTGRDLVLAALTELTKLPLDAKPKKGKAAKAKGADDGVVLQITSELKSTAARATNPDAVSDAEIETLLEKVKASDFSDAQLKDIALAVTGVKEKTGGKALLALRGKLTAAKRGLEGQKA